MGLSGEAVDGTSASRAHRLDAIGLPAGLGVVPDLPPVLVGLHVQPQPVPFPKNRPGLRAIRGLTDGTRSRATAAGGWRSRYME